MKGGGGTVATTKAKLNTNNNKTQSSKIKAITKNLNENKAMVNIFSNESNGMENAYDVNQNLVEEHKNSKSADIVFIVDMIHFKKFGACIKKATENLLNDFKNYYLKMNPSENDELIRIFLIKYNSSNLEGPTLYPFSKLYDMISSMDQDIKSNQKGGEIECINKLNQIDFITNNARFAFHFCREQDKKDEKQAKALNEEIDAGIRDLNLKYELFFFNNLQNGALVDALEQNIKIDVNLVDIKV